LSSGSGPRRSHNFPPDFPSVEVATGLLSWCLSRPDVYAVVAELDGRVIGSNFLWEGGAVSGVGPITIDPKVQNASVGRRLMENVLDRAGWGSGPDNGSRDAGVRLVQAGYHCRSLALYTKLGFEAREQLACLQGARPMVTIPGRTVRAAADADVPACSSLCRQVHGVERRSELEGAIAQGTARVVQHDGRISGYATVIRFFGHAVGESNDDLKALLGGPGDIAGPGVLVPTRNADLFRWCLNHGLRVTQTMTLMSRGLYHEPRGAWLPSILY
jgi:GNAT superfamily N-acetyltransferase